MWKLIALLFTVFACQVFSEYMNEKKSYRTYYEIKSNKNQFCNFSNYENTTSFRPHYFDSCTDGYYKTNSVSYVGRYITSRYPWCPLRTKGEWNYCTHYYWQYYVKDNFEGSDEKLYYYYYYYNGYSYENARKTCISLGNGWDLSSFQTMFNSSHRKIYENENYKTSLKNIRGILDTLKATHKSKLNFWVKNDQKFNYLEEGEKNYNKYFNQVFCLSYDFINNSISYIDCKKTRSFVCEKDFIVNKKSSV